MLVSAQPKVLLYIKCAQGGMVLEWSTWKKANCRRSTKQSLANSWIRGTFDLLLVSCQFRAERETISRFRSCCRFCGQEFRNDRLGLLPIVRFALQLFSARAGEFVIFRFCGCCRRRPTLTRSSLPVPTSAKPDTPFHSSETKGRRSSARRAGNTVAAERA
jgi:hypothetical protein